MTTKEVPASPEATVWADVLWDVLYRTPGVELDPEHSDAAIEVLARALDHFRSLATRRPQP